LSVLSFATLACRPSHPSSPRGPSGPTSASETSAALDPVCTPSPPSRAIDVPTAFFAALAARDPCALRRLLEPPLTTLGASPGTPGLSARCLGEVRDPDALADRVACLVADFDGRAVADPEVRVVPPVAVLPELRDAFADPGLVFVRADASGSGGRTTCTFAVVEQDGRTRTLGVSCQFVAAAADGA
jgi:hypothetical protein